MQVQVDYSLDAASKFHPIEAQLRPSKSLFQGGSDRTAGKLLSLHIADRDLIFET